MAAAILMLFFRRLLLEFRKIFEIGVVAVDEFTFAIEVIEKDIIIVNDETKDVPGKSPGDIQRHLLVLAVVIGENTDPAVDWRPEPQLAIMLDRDLLQNLFDGPGIFSSYQDGIKP